MNLLEQQIWQNAYEEGYNAGYAAAKRKFSRSTWEGDIDCMGGAFRPDEIEAANSWGTYK